MKIVEYSKGSITEVENVFKVVESGAQGPKGEKGDTGSSGASNSRDGHGPISVTEEFSANFTEHTATIAASMDFTFAGFSAEQPRIDIEGTLSSSGIDISLPSGFVVTSDSQQTLTSMASGVYDIIVKSYDNGASGIITVSQAGASATSSITEPIFAADNIALLFSEAQNPATVLTIGNGTGTVELFNVTAAVFAPAVISTADNTAWSLNPDSNMTVGNDYELHLKKEITSLVGNRKYSGENQTFTVAASPFEDYTTYTEVDSDGALTVTTNKIAGVNIPRNADDYVYKDFGVAFFSGDFTHEFEITLKSGADASSQFSPWCMSTLVDNAQALDAGAGSMLYCMSSGSAGNIDIRETIAGSRTASATIALSFDTKYYARITRDEAVGSFGELTLFIYSDSTRTSLVGSEAVTLTVKTDYRYLYGINSWNSGNALFSDADLENLNLI